jgi:hypothetical protein
MSYVLKGRDCEPAEGGLAIKNVVPLFTTTKAQTQKSVIARLPKGKPWQSLFKKE